jgi:Flp pilus assembly protein protease CpaA
MEEASTDGQLPPSLRFLKWLVIVLMIVMIAGVITIVGLLVTRMDQASVPMPENIVLPEGTRAQAVTAAEGWFAVVTTDNRILIFDRLTGHLRQEVAVTQGN